MMIFHYINNLAILITKLINDATRRAQIHPMPPMITNEEWAKRFVRAFVVAPNPPKGHTKMPEPPPKMKLMTTSQPVDWLVAWREQADEECMTLSQWVGECCDAYLPDDVRTGLSVRRPRGGSQPHTKKKKPAKVKPVIKSTRKPITENFSDIFQT